LNESQHTSRLKLTNNNSRCKQVQVRQ